MKTRTNDLIDFPRLVCSPNPQRLSTDSQARCCIETQQEQEAAQRLKVHPGELR